MFLPGSSGVKRSNCGLRYRQCLSCGEISESTPDQHRRARWPRRVAGLRRSREPSSCLQSLPDACFLPGGRWHRRCEPARLSGGAFPCLSLRNRHVLRFAGRADIAQRRPAFAARQTANRTGGLEDHLDRKFLRNPEWREEKSFLIVDLGKLAAPEPDRSSTALSIVIEPRFRIPHLC